MKTAIFSAALLALAFGGTAQGAASLDVEVACKDGAEPGDVCRGSLEAYSPSPAVIENEDGSLETVYVGGWHWSYTFVRGLPDGHTDPDAYNSFPPSYGIYDYGSNVYVTMEDENRKCRITVGNETCNGCYVCGNGDMSNIKLTADCTNLNTQNYVPGVGAGKMMTCEPTLPFFYPFEIPDDLPALPPVSP